MERRWQRAAAARRNGIKFRIDDAYDSAVQTGDELYADNPLDRGHIARRADLLWGSREQAQQPNTDSFSLPTSRRGASGS